MWCTVPTYPLSSKLCGDDLLGRSLSKLYLSHLMGVVMTTRACQTHSTEIRHVDMSRMQLLGGIVMMILSYSPEVLEAEDLRVGGIAFAIL